jgi:hypothetical protein
VTVPFSDPGVTVPPGPPGPPATIDNVTDPQGAGPGQAAAAGNGAQASPENHTHPTPAWGPDGDVVTQAFGDAPSAGGSGHYSDAAHRHGMPAAPAASSVSLIASQVLVSAAASITFSSIPGTFNHLRLIGQARSAVVAFYDAYAVQFNGDTGTNYDEVIQVQTGAALSGTTSAAQSSFGLGGGNGNLPGASNNAAFAGEIELEIVRYTATTFGKGGKMTAGFADGVDASWQQSASRFTWRNSAAAVTSIKVATHSGSSFIAGTALYLYGVT